MATENRIRAGADAAMGYPRFGMIDLLKLLGGLRHQERAALLKRRLAEAGPPVMPSPSYIVPGPGVASIPELGERLALGYQFHIASSREQAIREAASHCDREHEDIR